MKMAIALILMTCNYSMLASAEPETPEPMVAAPIKEISRTVTRKVAIDEFLEIRKTLKNPEKEDKGKEHFTKAVDRAVAMGKSAVLKATRRLDAYLIYLSPVMAMSSKEEDVDEYIQADAEDAVLKQFYLEDENKTVVPNYVQIKSEIIGPGKILHPTCKAYMPNHGFQGEQFLQAQLHDKGYRVELVEYDLPVETFESPEPNGLVIYVKFHYIRSPWLSDRAKSCRADVYIGAGRGQTIKKTSVRNYAGWTFTDWDCDVLIHKISPDMPACQVTQPGLVKVKD
jgi:hypothetical protein